jgi:hypothetical protein
VLKIASEILRQKKHGKKFCSKKTRIRKFYAKKSFENLASKTRIRKFYAKKSSENFALKKCIQEFCAKKPMEILLQKNLFKNYTVEPRMVRTLIYCENFLLLSARGPSKLTPI